MSVRDSDYHRSILKQPEPETFGEFLFDRIEELGLSYKGVAALVGVDYSNVSRWVSGERMPLASQIDRLADALGLNHAERVQWMAAAGRLQAMLTVEQAAAICDILEVSA